MAKSKSEDQGFDPRSTYDLIHSLRLKDRSDALVEIATAHHYVFVHRSDPGLKFLSRALRTKSKMLVVYWYSPQGIKIGAIYKNPDRTELFAIQAIVASDGKKAFQLAGYHPEYLLHDPYQEF